MKGSSKIALGIGVAALLVAAVFYYRSDSTTGPVDGPVSTLVVESESPSPVSQPSVDPVAASSEPGRHAANAAGGSQFLESGYRWNPVQPGIAQNAEDAAWLAAHGYPGPDVEHYLMSLSVDALRRLAAGGNQPAQAILAYRLAQSGSPPDEVTALLERSAADGSVYALKMAGDIFQTVPTMKNPEMAHAYYGLLTRRGDQGGLIANSVFGDTLTAEERARSRMLEEILWRNVMQRRQRPFDLSMRPGFISLMEQSNITKERME
ncbi:hypothetical protein E2F46_06255 [Luteimonas aestuarii]|uniref:Uncharacterized protein n=1 Tax=Luteimonas aestuarii TaxID=453837 RepID=A0A4R5TY95_9GAMM|nr:hypothetical protein [Luteimonas aestuarii]TDK26197.1 hypothetical protein E2F46_06255 [Luteimonas aestuarii]